MAGAFETIGTAFEQSISGYAEDVSGALIGNISPVIMTGISIYFLLKAYLYMTGRADGAVVDTMITVFKIAFISMIGLNSGNFISMGIGLINGAEDLLLGALPNSVDTASIWGSVDQLWSEVGDGLQSLINLFSKLDFSFGNIGESFLYALLLVGIMGTFLIAASFLTMASLGVIIIAKLSLVLILGFGPLFISLLMFPLTRSWFDGWLKACLIPVFTMVIMAAVLALLGTIFSEQMAKLATKINSFADAETGGFAELAINVMTFLILCVAIATLIKAVPSLAAGVVGGIALGAVGLGTMMSGVAGGAAKIAAGGAGIYAGAVNNQLLRHSAANVMSGRTSVSQLGVDAAGRAANFAFNAYGSMRSRRALNAALASNDFRSSSLWSDYARSNGSLYSGQGRLTNNAAYLSM